MLSYISLHEQFANQNEWNTGWGLVWKEEPNYEKLKVELFACVQTTGISLSSFPAIAEMFNVDVVG